MPQPKFIQIANSNFETRRVNDLVLWSLNQLEPEELIRPESTLGNLNIGIFHDLLIHSSVNSQLYIYPTPDIKINCYMCFSNSK